MANITSKGAPQALQALCLTMLVGHAGLLQAQDSANVLGLPAVPQKPAVAASAAKTPAVPAKPSDADIKSVLSGNLKLVSFYQEGLITLRVSTDRTFVGDAVRAQALQAARLVQRDTRVACGKLCKPAPMPAPALQADNTLSFDIVISGYVGNMSTADMVNLVSGKRVGAATQTAPIVAPPASPAGETTKP
jgi:hypothetical protein